MFSYNYLCLFTLFKKEIFRFFKVGIQTVVGPAISSLLFLAVFSLALGRSVNQINNVNLVFNEHLFCSIEISFTVTLSSFN